MDARATEAFRQRQDDNCVVASLAESACLDYARVEIAWNIGKAHNRCGPPIHSTLEKGDVLGYRRVVVRQLLDHFCCARTVKAHLVGAARYQWSVCPGQ